MDDIIKNSKNTRTNHNKIIQVGPTTEGKLPPQNMELEEAVLGGIMLDKDAIGIVIEILTPESFYKDAHTDIFKACCNLYSRGEPIDLLTVTQELRRLEILELVGGAYFITQLTTRLTSAANIEFHARIIKEKHLQRCLIKISNETIRNSYEDSTDVFDLIDKTESAIFNITKDLTTQNEANVGDLVFQKIKQIENHKEGDIVGYLTGLNAIDSITLGIKKQDLVILAARPGMGKTALALTIAKNLAVDQNIPVSIFSLEMGKPALTDRLISLNSEIPLKFIINNQVTGSLFQKLMIDYPLFTKAPLFIDDQGGISINQLRSKVRRHISKYGTELIIVDYLQKLRGNGDRKNGTREQEINEIVSALKNIAKEFDIPVIALSQLSREVEKRSDKAPQLSDLRESGAIEQEADKVWFLYRPGYYEIEKDSSTGEPVLPGECEIIHAKHRNGALGTEKAMFLKDYTKFVNLGSFQEQSFTSAQNISQYVTAELPKRNYESPPQADDLPF